MTRYRMHISPFMLRCPNRKGGRSDGEQCVMIHGHSDRCYYEDVDE